MIGNSTTARKCIVLVISLILLSGWIAVHKHTVRAFIALAVSGSDEKEYRFEKIELTREAPKTLDSLVPARDAYFRMRLEFEVAPPVEGHPNIFQTGPFDTGARLEITGSTATLVIRNDNEPSGVMRSVVSWTLPEQRICYLDVEVLNGAFISAKLNENDFITGNLSLIDLSDIRIGIGFNGERDDGLLRNVSLTTRHANARIYNELRFWVPIADKVVLAAVILGFFVWGARSRVFVETIAKLLILFAARLFIPIAASMVNFSKRLSIPALVCIAIVSGIIFAAVRINGLALVDEARLHRINLATNQVSGIL